MTRVLLILSICLAIHAHQTNGALPALFAVVNTIKDIHDYTSAVRGIVEDAEWPATGPDPSNADVIRYLNGAMTNVTKRLYNMEGNLLNEIKQVGETLLHRLPLKIQRDTRLHQLTTRINEVNDVYDHFVFYQNDSHTYANTTVTRFMTELVGDSSKLNHALDSIFDQLLSNEQISPNLLSIITAAESHDENRYEERCDQMSPQKKLYEIYRKIMLTEMQGYAMNVYAWGVLKQGRNVSYTGELNKLETQFRQRCGQYLRSVKSVMSTMSREVHLCEPENHIRGRTFNEFVKLFQSFILLENPRPWHFLGGEAFCGPNCDEQSGNAADQPLTQSCSGRYRDCTARYGHELLGCRLPDTESRRYAWIKNGNDEPYGESIPCPTNAKTEGFVRYELWLTNPSCYTCSCLCADDQRHDSNVYNRINFEPQMADIAENMVVTGVKMVMENGMLHLQIEQGKLTAREEIETVVPAWKPIKKPPESGGVEGINFGQIKYERRKIHLDDIIAADHFVVTGVKFGYRSPRSGHDVSDNDMHQFAIQVHATEYKFDTGKLELVNSQWLVGDTMIDFPDYQRDRTEVTLDEPDNPIKARKNLVFSKPNQFIKLRESDFRKDAGQSTVPYLDVRPISMEPRLALSGIGLYHRGEAGFGGFLGLRLFGLNISAHMTSYLPREDE